MARSLGAVLLWACAASGAEPPKPTQAQLDLMDLGLAQFMHFSLEPFNSPHIEHNCVNKKETCLPASSFNPTNLSTDEWVQTAVAFGAKEICLTAHHEGGFALWPSQHNLGYSVAASPYGKDVVRQFVDSCHKYGVRVCYYIGPNANGWLNNKNVSPEEFVDLQLAQYKELLSSYGPISRFWWDHYGMSCNGQLDPCPGGFPQGWNKFASLIRELSPSTIICPGPDCSGHLGEGGRGTYPAWYNCDYPHPEDPSMKCKHSPTGKTFRPLETCITPIGNWFPTGTGVGEMKLDLAGYWDVYRKSVGIGYINTINAPPGTTGQIPTDMADLMVRFGSLIAPLSSPLASMPSVSAGACAELSVELDVKGLNFNTIALREGLVTGQRITGYSIEFSSRGEDWTAYEICAAKSHDKCVHGQSVGALLIDSLAYQTSVEKIRFRCLESVADPVALASFSVTMLAVPAGHQRLEEENVVVV